MGYSEISCAAGKTKNSIWKVHSGFYFPLNKERKFTEDDDDYGHSSEDYEGSNEHSEEL